jgi:hypothetical protein
MSVSQVPLVVDEPIKDLAGMVAHVRQPSSVQVRVDLGKILKKVLGRGLTHE